MKIIVCVKIVDGELNPFDACALECALSLSNDVTVLSMSPMSAEGVLKGLTRLGAKVIMISDRAYAGSDTLATAYILSQAIKNIEYDLIFCGRQSIDGDTAQVGPCLATMLKIGLITNALSIHADENKVKCKTRFKDEESSFPALVTVERINELRFPSLRSKISEIEVWDNSKIGADVSRCGLSGSPTRVLKTYENEHGKRKCQFINRDELYDIIKNHKKSEKKQLQLCEKKLKSVWAIGQKVAEYAKNISQEVILIEETNPKRIAEMARSQKPEVILWNADLWGRRTAPQVQALLDTGLCADCTELDTDGEKLLMYRPAKGGKIIAKIECIKNPQMATVRTVSESDDILVAGGKGVGSEFDMLCDFAKQIGADVCASRGLVDMGKAPYEMQVGLTGKAVSPEIYIAIGISGAVHHICGMESSGLVIAVNPDKQAPIFEYADYGVVCNFEDILR